VGKISMEELMVADVQAAGAYMAEIGVSPAGAAIMQEKMIFRVLRLRQVPTKAANLIKQTFLSKGADAAVSVHSADLSEPFTDVLLFASIHQYRQAVISLRRQPWGLRELAEDIAALLGISLEIKQDFVHE